MPLLLVYSEKFLVYPYLTSFSVGSHRCECWWSLDTQCIHISEHKLFCEGDAVIHTGLLLYGISFLHVGLIYLPKNLNPKFACVIRMFSYRIATATEHACHPLGCFLNLHKKYVQKRLICCLKNGPYLPLNDMLHIWFSHTTYFWLSLSCLVFLALFWTATQFNQCPSHPQHAIRNCV